MKRFLLIFFILLFIFSMNFPNEVNGGKKVKGDLSKVLFNTAKLINNLNSMTPDKPGYKKIKKRILRHLRRSIVITESGKQKKYFQSLTKTFKDNDFSVLGKGNVFIPGTRSDLLLDYDEKSKIIFPVVLKTDSEANADIEKLFGLIKVEIKKGMMNRKVRFFPEEPVIKISDILFPENYEDPAIVLPLQLSDESIHPGVVLVRNVIERIFKKRIEPASKKIYNKEDVLNVTFLSFKRNLFLHRLSHFTFPIQLESSGEKRTFSGSRLKELLKPAEELRADLNFIVSICEMEKKDILDSGIKKEVIYTFLVQKFEKIKLLEEKETISPSLILINSFFTGGGIKKNRRKGWVNVDLDLLIRNIKVLETRIEDFVKKGKLNDCKTFFQKNNKMTEQIKEILKNI